MNNKYFLKIYVANNGARPFVNWLESLDASNRYRVKERLDRAVLGNLGDFKPLGDGIYELRLTFGGGYRIYFAKERKEIVLLLSAGNKSGQSSAIRKAKQYYIDYQTRQP